jgi:hypothetical protein
MLVGESDFSVRFLIYVFLSELMKRCKFVYLISIQLKQPIL